MNSPVTMPGRVPRPCAGAATGLLTEQAGRHSRRMRCWPATAAVLALALILACATLAGCNKGKQAATTPAGSSGSVATEDTGLMGHGAAMDPASGGTSPDGQDRSNASTGEDSAARGDRDPTNSSEAGRLPPAIEPPDLDMDPGAAAERVGRHLQVGRAALRGISKDPDVAIREARAALEVDGTSIDAVVLLAHGYHAKRLDDTAEVALDMLFKSNEQASSNPGVYYVYGLIYDATARPERAMVAYQKAVELAPDHGSALINVGAHYLRNKSYQQAIGTYEKLIEEQQVGGAVVVTNLGSAYRGRSGDYPVESAARVELLRRAESSYKRALTADRDYANAYYNLGLLYLDAEPFPGPDGAPLDRLRRLELAKTYFDEYRAISGADLDLVERRLKEVNKLIKRETKRRQREQKNDRKNDRKSTPGSSE